MEILQNLATWVGSMTLEHANYTLMEPPKKTRIFMFYSYIHVDTWTFGWSYIPNVVHMNGCSSRPYSHDTLIFPILFTENKIHSNSLPKNSDPIHNIHTSTIHYSYRC